ncbi:hypothetical protein [Actinoplanes sp. TFC3]|uniref:hypothetical protein n=1 Tax=Actinoplanes sp. TFC3 TaxID=1710355 RepID=UPI000AB865D8|nr:hypothetical protein [Actinoplanes sp. TFC3]
MWKPSRRYVIAVLLLTLAGCVVVRATREPPPPPFLFGTLETLPEHAATEAAHGIRVAMLEADWGSYEPADGRFDDAYAQRLRERIASYRAAGMRVTLGLGLHYTPAWLLRDPGSRLVDQHGNRSAGLNLVFSRRMREKAARYLSRLDRDLDLSSFWALRLTSGAQPEVLYPPGGSYWAFDPGAQNGPDRPPGVAPNPLPGWRPGDRSVPVTEIRTWADWYVHSLAGVVTWQIDLLSGLGFTGYFQVLTPGAGSKPFTYARDIAEYLPDGITGVGAVWHVFYAALPANPRLIAYVSSMADEPGQPHLCDPGDREVPLTDPRVSGWPATRWLTRVAAGHGFGLSGENPGLDFPARLNGHYRDTSPRGMMAAGVQEMASCGFQGFYWAHDQQLWDRRPWNGTGAFERYADLIAKVNAGRE